MSRNLACFISDAHLGAVTPAASERESRLISFLETIPPDIGYLFIVGDLFDFWIEYDHAIRPEYFRVLHELMRLRKAGVEIHYVAGNHDFALSPFLSNVIGMTIHPSGCLTTTLQDKLLYICHGDGLIPSDKGPRVMKKILCNPVCQKIYKRLHPNTGVAIAEAFSRLSRTHIHVRSHEAEQEAYRQIAFSLLKGAPDIVIFAHTHYPEIRSLNGKIYCNTGDWIEHFSYAMLKNGELSLRQYGSDNTIFEISPF